MKSKIFFILALLCAFLAAALVYLYLENLERDLKDEQDYLSIPVAGQDIPAGEAVTGGMVATEDLPASQVHPRAARDRNEIVGTVTRTPLFRGEQFLEEKLLLPGESPETLAQAVSPGKRAVAVAVNEIIAVGYHLQPGDHVDVVAVIEDMGDERRLHYASLFVQDLRVLAVGSEMTPCQVSAPLTVTLEATPREAKQLVLASDRGSIRLLLRSPADGGTAPLPRFRINEF